MNTDAASTSLSGLDGDHKPCPVSSRNSPAACSIPGPSCTKALDISSKIRPRYLLIIATTLEILVVQSRSLRSRYLLEMELSLVDLPNSVTGPDRLYMKPDIVCLRATVEKVRADPL